MRTSRRGLVIAASLITATALATGVAWAYWSAQADSVPALSKADVVGAGSQPTVTVNADTVALSWAATTTTAGRGVTGYLVSRYPAATGGTATAASQGTCAATPVTGLTCSETSTPGGSWYYTVTPVLGAWRGSESARSTAAVVNQSHTFALSWTAGGTRTAGVGSTLTITALVGAQTDATYNGGKTLTFSGPGAAPNGASPSYNGGNPSVTFTNGVATAPVTLYKAESTTLTVTDGTSSGSLPTTVTPAAASRLQVPTPATPTAGTTFSLTLTAQDPYRNTATSYTGNKTLAWTGPGTAPNGTSTPTYQNPVTFTNGVATTPVTLYRAETTTLTVSDGTNSGSTTAFTVLPATASSLDLPTPAAQTAGTAFTVTLTALDAYRNRVTSYTGGKTLNWTGTGTLGNSPSGSTPLYPTNPVSFTSGAATVSITPVKAETATLKVTDSTINGTSATFTINPGAATKLAWTNVTVSAGTLSTPCLFTCTANAVGNNKNFTARVAVTDDNGNTVNNLVAGTNVTVTTAGGGSFTAPTPVPNGGAGPITLTISTSGPAVSTQQFTLTTQNGAWTTDTLTATKTGYTSATATINKA
ncbi:hypothetical protein [Actinophytocola sp.]|uniref:hypothetical protein n=1 Tax=Actinophytocola sp. TaxID=1872138 RepID=UPI002ED614E4